MSEREATVEMLALYHWISLVCDVYDLAQTGTSDFSGV